jgi:hypothetical protein
MQLDFNGEKIMNLFMSKITAILSSIVLALILGTSASAQELNLPGFSGSINTTVTSGISMRVERDCLSVRGTKLLPDDTGGAFATAVNADSTIAGPDKSVFISDGEGCARRYTDGYGNTGLTTSGARSLIGANADNGRTNFDGGDIFDVTQRVYSEVTGNTDDGMSVNLSFVGTYNPVVDVNGNPEFAPFTSKQQDDIETNLTLLNAYVTRDINMDHSVTAGRFVTSWGESTFIPIGMNGLTTNAVDLSKLRNPGGSIKEALIPTEQITLEGFLDDGWSYEAYLQFNEAHVELDEAGQFFGSDVASGDRLVISGQYSRNDQMSAHGCGFLISMPTAAGGQGLGCTQSALDYYGTAAGPTKSEMYLYQAGLGLAFSSTNAAQMAVKSGIAGTAAAGGWGGSAGDIPVLGTTATAAVVAAFTTNWDIYTRKAGSKAGAVDLSGGNHIFADGEDQFGFSLRKFLPNVGTGVDLGFHFTQFDSKVPYLRLKGQQALVAGDLLGMFTIASKHATGEEATLAAYMGAGALIGSSAITETAQEITGFATILGGLGNVAYSEAACGAYQKAKSADDVYGRGDASALLYSDAEVQLSLTQNNYTAIGGKLYHDATKCYANGAAFGTASTQSAAAALLGAAVTPLNAAEYEFIYPENLQAFGVSANTNIGSTALQLEMTYRPDFPLATDGSDQGQQLSDAAGTTTLLAQGVAKGLYAVDAAKALTLSSYQQVDGKSSATWADLLTDVKNFKRSYLPAISMATVAAGDYYTTPYFNYDVISGTIGTTTLFSASHPVTTSLGADNTVLLSEVGFVYVDGLSMDRPVARGGYRDGVGGVKCGGITQGGALGATNFGGTANAATVGGTHLGSAQTDPLFGNGGYCEMKNNADEMAMTYRLIGSASYNNIANTPWSLSNSLVWSHDFSGYAPSSMGGFVPGKQSLSLSSTLTKGSVKASVSYVNQMGDPMDNLGFDMDYVSASMSYAF